MLKVEVELKILRTKLYQFHLGKKQESLFICNDSGKNKPPTNMTCRLWLYTIISSTIKSIIQFYKYKTVISLLLFIFLYYIKTALKIMSFNYPVQNGYFICAYLFLRTALRRMVL